MKLLARLANPLHQRFVSWATELEEIIGRDTVFLTPRIWRDTEINEPRPMPILKLGPRVTVVEGTPRQWEAFQMDFEDAETWALAINGVEERTFKVPTAKDSALIIRAGIGLGEPKLAAFGQTLEATLTRKQFAGLRHELASLQLQITPTGTTKARLGLGPPHRRRLLVPRWYEELTRIHLPHVGARRMDTLAGGTSLGT
ncbi:MAG: hypothetical protein HY556_07045 [Euryarchaeota archaeon]|nr:hypothetical protein [Euryarchaeota archaeon]